MSTLTALDILELVEPGPALVLAPLRVAASTWPDEAGKWDHLRNVEVSAVVGTPEERRAALRRPASVFSTNYENLPWLIEHLGDKWPFRKVVADESTKLKSFRLRQGGKRAQALGRVAHSKVSRFIELTGTPSPNGLQDLWGQAWFLDQGVRLGRTYDSFKQRWFQAVPGGDGYQQIRPLPHAQREIEERLRDLCLSLDARDYFDIREPIVNVIRVDLPSKARKLYRDMEREMFMQVDEHEVEAFSAAAKTIKCLQLANGAAYTDDGGSWTEVHDAKLQALESVVEEAAGAPVLVFVVPRRYVKGRKRERIIVCNSVAQSIVDAQRGLHEERVFTFFRAVKKPGKVPKHKATDSMNNTAWQNACDAAGLDIRLHDLRHTVGMRLREAGVSERTQDEILWHSKGTMTNHYAVAQVREIYDALELIKEPTGHESVNVLALVRGQVPQNSPPQRKTA